MHPKMLGYIVVFTLFIFLIGCTHAPDLVPVGKEGIENPTKFCDVTEEMLIVTIKNQGNVDAGASTTEVSFGNFGTQSQNIPAIAVGASESATFNIPVGCFNPDCSFEITVDSENDVIETSTGEGNNTELGDCIG